MFYSIEWWNLCSLSVWASCAPVQKLSARIAVACTFQSVRHLNTHQSSLISQSAGLTNRSRPTGVAYICDICLLCGLVLVSTSTVICAYISGNTCRMSTKYVQKTLCFDESKSLDEWIRTGQLHQLCSLKNQVCKGMLASKISCLDNSRGEGGMMIIIRMFFHRRSEESSHQPFAQCMFCYFKYSNQFLAHSELRSQLHNKHGIY